MHTFVLNSTLSLRASKMHKKGLFVVFITALIHVTCGHAPSKVKTEVLDSQEETKIQVGAERFVEYLPYLKGKRVALMVNPTSMVGETHLVDTLHSLAVNITKIFAPEHGFRGDHSAGAHVSNEVDKKTGIPIVSLYGKHRKPTGAMLQDVDILIFDVQDVGVRFYTYISSMHYLMEACAANDKEFLVLDRPNPNGHYVDGPVLEPKYKSFIGMHPVPLVHGMTVGEFAFMINGEGWLENGDTCKLFVVKCAGYTHQTPYALPVKPSPNLPTMESIYLYPSLGLFEGTNVSVGRGTDKPFQILGRPGEPNKEFSFKPVPIKGVSDNPKHKNKVCYGVDLTETAMDLVYPSKTINLSWLKAFYESNDASINGPFFKSVFDKLAGTDKLRKQIEAGTSIEEIKRGWKNEVFMFKLRRKIYLLYP
jgi:uncharacterized protein YbbC (DUF1343 family)